MQHLLRKGLGSPHVTSRAGRRRPAQPRARARARGPVGSRVATSTTPARSSCSTPSWSTRRRSSTCACARRCGATAPGSWWPRAGPRTLDPAAAAALRFAPGAAEAALARWRPRSARPGGGASLDELATARRHDGLHPGRPQQRRGRRARRRRARRRRGAARRRRRVVICGRARASVASAARQAGEALLAVADALGIADKRRVRPDRDPGRDERPRPARGRLLPASRPACADADERAGDPDSAARRARCCSRPTRPEPELARRRAR